jgi:glycosyltransferase involved in cell wall biosynthesis
MKLSALIVCRNEEGFVKDCIESIHPYVDEIIFVDNESEDKSAEIAKGFENVKLFTYPKTQNMGELRQFSLDQAQGEWIWQIDCDELYQKGSIETILRHINDPGEAISFRVWYYNVAWRNGYVQDNFYHFPDRLYKREVIDQYSGILPNDMTKVKPEYYTFRPFLEYDNQDDKSFENPKQPILPVKYYHLARTRGYNFEYTKWYQYNKNIHPETSHEELDRMTRLNQWVSGLYPTRKQETRETTIKNPKVSVIITNYNYNEYLPESVGSIKNQTYPAHEIIIVDDCSRVKPEIEGVKILQQKENRGVVESRNWGIYESTGDYYICIDADDILEPTFIEECLKEMKGDIQIVYSNYKVFGEASYECDYGEFSGEKLKQFQTIPSCCALVDRHCFELSGGYSNEDHWEDWGYWLRLSNLGFNFKRVDKFLFNYRRHAGSRIDLLDQNKEKKLEEFKKRHNI